MSIVPINYLSIRLCVLRMICDSFPIALDSEADTHTHTKWQRKGGGKIADGFSLFFRNHFGMDLISLKSTYAVSQPLSHYGFILLTLKYWFSLVVLFFRRRQKEKKEYKPIGCVSQLIFIMLEKVIIFGDLNRN